MKPVMQTKTGAADSPTEDRGNCFGACVASIMEAPLDRMPDAPYDENGWESWEDWLLERGLYLLHVGTDNEYAPPPGWSVGWIQSNLSDDWGHFIVCWDGSPAHDPDPDTQHMVRSAYDIDSYTVFCVTDLKGCFGGD